jgi:hypothetical protein
LKNSSSAALCANKPAIIPIEPHTPETTMPHTQSYRDRPGEGPANQIAATAEEQLARAMAGRPIEPLSEPQARRLALTLHTYPEHFRPVLLQLLADNLAAAMVGIVADIQATERKAA